MNLLKSPLSTIFLAMTFLVEAKAQVNPHNIYVSAYNRSKIYFD